MANELAHHRFRKCRNSYFASGVPRFLNLNRNVFLSHSSGDKEFVWSLHEQLCNHSHDAVAFFDDVTFPEAEPVSMEDILTEAKGSQLGVLVLTEDFFMRTQMPMLELVELTTSRVPLLPLFFEMNVGQFKEESRRARWENQWEKWAAGDKGVVKQWKDTLNFLNTFAGLEFDMVVPKTPQEYICKIVEAVDHIIRPDLSLSEEGVYGMDRICKIVEGMYERCTLKRTCIDGAQVASTSTSAVDVDVVGVYGFAGLGKTTLCKALCDNYFAVFNSKVCYIDLGSRPCDQVSSQTHSSEAFSLRMQYILSVLTDCINDDCISDDKHLKFSEVRNMLEKQISSMVDPVFLAIDNVLGEDESQIEASFYLSLKFPKGTKIFLTSRSCGILENLASHFSSFPVEIDHIPGLELKEARDIFVHEIAEVRDPSVLNVQDEVNDVVNMCRIHLHDARGDQWASAQYHHPLMLKSLAASIKCKRTRNLDWKKGLAKLQSEGIVDKDDAWKMVYIMLDISYALLEEDTKTMFLDLLLFYSATRNAYQIQDWVKRVYTHFDEEELKEIESKLLQLQDLFCIRERSQPPELLVDFAKYKASHSMDPQYVVVDGEPCPQNIRGNVRHLSISRCVKARTLDLRNVQGLEVLHLVDNAGLQEVRLSRTTCTYLRSVIVRVPPGISLHFTMDEDLSISAADQQQSMAFVPRWVEVGSNVILPTLTRS